MQNLEEEKESHFQEEVDLNEITLERLKLEENLPFALGAGVIAGIIAAISWGLLTFSTGYQIGYMAVGVGFLVGYTIRITGKGISTPFGIAGGAISFVSCVLGNYLTIVAAIASELDISMIEVFFSYKFSTVVKFMAENFSFIDILFYGIAVYEGFRFSFRVLPEQQIEQ